MKSKILEIDFIKLKYVFGRYEYGMVNICNCVDK